MKRSWKIKPLSEERIQKLGEDSGISPLLSRLLILRGIESQDDVQSFLSPSQEDIPSPYEFGDMEIAVKRIRRAIDRHERVLIHGDYDVDGITATAILLECLRIVGLQADWFLPDRMESGYGVQVETIREKAKDYDLLITVDCGTVDNEAMQCAKEAGLDVILTDHHSAGAERPPALAILNPVCPGETYPSKNLSGAGVAWKLASALLESYSKPSRAEDLLELVGLGMVADVVPLLGENRVLLVRALERFRNLERPGLLALMDLAKVIPSQMSPQDIGFRLGPRLNAAGRMDHPQFALELLLTTDETRAMELARHLHQLNTQRQSIETKILKEACAQVERENLLERSPQLLVITGDQWHRGVLGIVASRLVQIYQRSVFLLTREEGIAIGSARSVDGFDLVPLLHAARPHTLSCGGHAGAGGVKVLPDRIPVFEKALYHALIEEPVASEPSPLWLDAKVPLEQIDAAFMSEIKRLEPCGEGNEEPLFLSQGAMNGMGARIVGNNHLRLTLRHPRGTFTAIGFGQGDKLESLGCENVEIAFHCRWNEYQGRKEIDLHLRDIRPIINSPVQLKTTDGNSIAPTIDVPKTSERKIPDPKMANPQSPSGGQSRFTWDRATLGKVYKLLEKSCNEEKFIALQNAYLLAQLEKIGRSDFETVLKIFAEIELLAIRDGKIIIHEVKEKRNLGDSPTYRSILEKNT